MKAILIILTLIPSFSFALENCVEYPSLDTPARDYKGVISEVSDRLSFNDCPDSVLVNDKTVARLSKIITKNNEKKCLYSTRSVSFLCEK